MDDRAVASQTLGETLFAGLLDDAAMFPPGLAPLSRALDDHRAMRSGPVDRFVGPLLVGAAAVGDLADLLTEQSDGPPPITIIGRSGDAAATARAFEQAHAADIPVTGVELALGGGAPSPLLVQVGMLLDAGVGVALEVSRQPTDDLAALATALEGADERVRAGIRAKYRTGGTTADAVPTSADLAAFIVGCQRHDLAFKLTAGLHHLVAASGHHGVANVMAAVTAAEQHDDPDPAIAAARGWLDATDPDLVLAEVRGWDAGTVARMRARFTSMGCCGVLDPLREAVAAGLLTEDDITT